MTTPVIPHSSYIGRFAPSPSGRLHFGSLVAAVASYCDAKHHQGQWLVRMEDLDPPREEAGAADAILKSLEDHGLYWDQSVLFQSTRLQAYEEAAHYLSADTYECNCPRHRIRELHGRYDNLCRDHAPAKESPSATRLRTDRLPADQLDLCEHFEDLFLGSQYLSLEEQGDFIIRRKDGLFAYQLAVAVDDAFQKITHVIRGADLLDSTNRQRYILSKLSAPLCEYGHTPLALKADGAKLSKQTRAPELDNSKNLNNLCNALSFLGHPLPPEAKQFATNEEILQWAATHWDRNRVPKGAKLAPP